MKNENAPKSTPFFKAVHSTKSLLKRKNPQQQCYQGFKMVVMEGID